MARADFFHAQPPPQTEVLLSLPANICTALVLIDYASNQGTTPTPWPYRTLARFSERERQLLGGLRSVLAHGTNLRDYFLTQIGPHEAAHREWPALLTWLEHRKPDEMTELIIWGILSGLEWYREHMEPDPEIERYLERLGSREPDRDMLRDPARRRIGLEALLRSWGYQDPSIPLSMSEDPQVLQEGIITLLTAVWREGMADVWSEGAAELERATQGALPAGGVASAEEHVLRVTGLQPPISSAGALRQARRITFVPCFHLGQSLSISRAEYGWTPARPGQDQYHLFYEPKSLREPRPSVSTAVQPMELAELGPSLEVLGDGTRLAMLQLLRAEGEMFANQVAERLQVHPSTISRHFTQLEGARLVRVRREGNLKYYTANQDRIRNLIRLLEQELG